MADSRRPYPKDNQLFTLAFKMLYQEPEMLAVLYPWREKLASLTNDKMDEFIDELTAQCPAKADRFVATMEQIVAYQRLVNIPIQNEVKNLEGRDYLSDVPEKLLLQIFRYLTPDDIVNLSLTRKRKTVGKTHNLSQLAANFVHSDQINELPFDRGYTLTPKLTLLAFAGQMNSAWRDVKQLRNGNLIIVYDNGMIQIIKKNECDDKYHLIQTIRTNANENNTYCVIDIVSADSFVSVTSHSVVECWTMDESEYFTRFDTYTLSFIPYSAYRILEGVPRPLDNVNRIQLVTVSKDGENLAVSMDGCRLFIFHKNHNMQYTLQTFEYFGPLGDIKAFGESGFITSILFELNQPKKLCYLSPDPVTFNYSIEVIPIEDIYPIFRASVLINDRLAITPNDQNTYIFEKQNHKWEKVGWVNTLHLGNNLRVIQLPDSNLLAYNDNGLQIFIRSSLTSNFINYESTKFIKEDVTGVIRLASGNCLLVEDSNPRRTKQLIFPSLSKAITKSSYIQKPNGIPVEFPTDRYKRTAYLWPLSANIMLAGFIGFMAWIFAIPIWSLLTSNPSLMHTPITKLYLTNFFLYFSFISPVASFFLIPYLSLRRNIDNLLVGRKKTKAIVSMTAIAVALLVGAAFGYMYPAYFISADWLSAYIKLSLFMMAGELIARVSNKINSSTGIFIGAILGCLYITPSNAVLLGLNKLSLLNYQTPILYQAMMISAIVFSIPAALISKYGMQIYKKIRYGNTNADGEGVECNADELNQLYQRQAKLFHIKPQEVKTLNLFLIKLLRDIKFDKYVRSIILFLWEDIIGKWTKPTSRTVYASEEVDIRQPRNSIKDMLHLLMTAKTEKEAQNFKKLAQVTCAGLRYSAKERESLQRSLNGKSRSEIHADRTLRLFSHQRAFYRACLGEMANSEDNLTQERVDHISNNLSFLP